MSTAVATDKDRFLDLVEQARPSGKFAKLREAARERFRALPLPGPRTEDWRFTNLAPLFRTSFELPPARATTPTDLPSLPDALRLVLMNGLLDHSRSRLDSVVACSLAEAPAEWTQKLGQVAGFEGHVFTALNTSLLEDGACIVVPDGKVVDQPIEIVHVAPPAVRPILVQPRTYVVAGKQSQVTIIERFVPGGQAAYFTNAVTEIVLSEGATVDHYKVQQEAAAAFHIANTQILLAGRSKFSTHYLGFGGGLVRNEVRVRFEAEHAEATVNGLYRGDGRQHIDNFTEIDHARAHCASHELYKGILGGQAHGVFNGKILVRPDAQKTDAKQTNKVLLLSDDATINTKPQLEIFADDVKCTHGATVGQLDEEQIYYLRSRGLDVDAARSLLMFAFANDIVGRVQVESLRQELEQLILQS